MANVSPKDYLPRLDQFSDHWASVDAALGSPMLLPERYGRSRLAEDRQALVERLECVRGAELRVEATIALRNQLRAALGERQRQFNAIVRAMMPDSDYADRLIRVPVPTSGPSVWLANVDDVARIWDEIASKLPITLADGYNRSDFERDRRRLAQTFEDMAQHTAQYREFAEARDAVWAEIYQRIRQYRLMVQGKFDSDSEIVESLPKLVKPYRRSRA